MSFQEILFGWSIQWKISCMTYELLHTIDSSEFEGYQ